jgi:hypothetical protein
MAGTTVIAGATYWAGCDFYLRYSENRAKAPPDATLLLIRIVDLNRRDQRSQELLLVGK